jgi:transcriptional regulator with XRE-family HTH domain
VAEGSVTIPATVLTLGEAVRFVREARGLTLRELARRIGVSAPFLSDIEHNRRSTEKLGDIARALDVPAEELTRFDTRISPDVKEWIVSNPGISRLLRDMKDSGLTPYQLRAALIGAKDDDDRS